MREQHARQPFRLPITDVFSIKNRGAVFTGVIESGTIRVGESVIVASAVSGFEAVVAGIEVQRRLLDKAGPGDAVAILLRSFDLSVIEDGAVETEPGDPGGAPAYKTISLAMSGTRGKWWRRLLLVCK